jgi:hypothetical protein
MGGIAFTRYKASIRAYILTLLNIIKTLKIQIADYKCKAEEGIDVNNSRVLLQENKANLSKTECHIAELINFFLVIDKKWRKRKDRVIGHVVWASPLGTGQAPYKYTCDLCVVELNKAKFKNLMGNVLCLGAKAVYLINFALI